MLAVDASTLVAALTDGGADGSWASSLLTAGPLVAPHLLPVEAASVLRRLQLGDVISADAAAMAHADVTDLRVRLLPYAPFASRIWELRDNLTPYDAWYVAVAEAFDVPLATFDTRLVGATGPRCRFATPA